MRLRLFPLNSDWISSDIRIEWTVRRAFRRATSPLERVSDIPEGAIHGGKEEKEGGEEEDREEEEEVAPPDPASPVRAGPARSSVLAVARRRFLFSGIQPRMNKQKLTEWVAKETDSSKAFAETCVNAVLDGIRTGLKKDHIVQLVGFGTFQVRNRKARMGRNPQTGATIKIKASKTVGFKAGKAFKSAL